MSSPLIAVCLTCFLPAMEAPVPAVKPSAVLQKGFLSVEWGQTLTPQCFYEGRISSRLYWYKYSLGQKPLLVSSFYMYDRNGSFHGGFKEDPRFRLDADHSRNHLTITDARRSDSATYYCASSVMFIFEFREGIMVVVGGSDSSFPVQIQQSTSERVRPGESVKLNCSVHTDGTCGAEGSVYWFRTSGDPHGGVIYTPAAGNDSCERRPRPRGHTCMYELSISSPDPSDAGTYYCAVASCGLLLLGNGTRLDLEDEVDPARFWMAASTLTSTLSVLLVVCVCMMKTRKNCSSDSETREEGSALSAGNTEADNAETLYYAALSVHLSKRSGRRTDPTWSECWYHGLKK